MGMVYRRLESGVQSRAVWRKLQIDDKIALAVAAIIVLGWIFVAWDLWDRFRHQ
jgi:hypothetical protein